MEDESLIIKKAWEGDLEAFSHLVNSYKKVVFNVCLRMLFTREEAEDAAQETFIKVYKAIRTYNGQSKFSTWILKIASNTCIDIIRKKRMQTVPIEDYEIRDDRSPEESYIKLEQRKAVENAVKKLPEKYRIMIIYFHFMNLSYQEICDLTGEPMTIVKNRLYRARLMLKDKLYEKEEESDGLQHSFKIDDGIS